MGNLRGLRRPVDQPNPTGPRFVRTLRAEENSMTDQEAADAEFGSRLREIMGAAVQSVADQAGPELAIAIAQRLDAGEWQLRTTVNLDGGQPDASTLRFHVLVEADNGLLELCSAKWPALGVPEESAREEARWTALQNRFGVPDDLSGLDSPS